MQVRDVGVQNGSGSSTDGQALPLNGVLRSRHAVVTVRTPEGETWTLRDVDWMTLRLTGDAGSLQANIELTGTLMADKDGVAVTLDREDQ